MSTKLENQFQAKLIKELHARFNSCVVMKLDSGYIQGIPDLIILRNGKWATLECKRSSTAPFRPNQETYNEKLNGMSFSRVIFPENKEAILDELTDFLRDV